MKKFGTPIGAGPGMAIDVVGSAIVGRPSWPALVRARASARASVRGRRSPAPRAAPSRRTSRASNGPPVVRCLRGFLPDLGLVVVVAARLVGLLLARSTSGFGVQPSGSTEGQKGSSAAPDGVRSTGASAIATICASSTSGKSISHRSVPGGTSTVSGQHLAVGERDLEGPDDAAWRGGRRRREPAVDEAGEAQRRERCAAAITRRKPSTSPWTRASDAARAVRTGVARRGWDRAVRLGGDR